MRAHHFFIIPVLLAAVCLGVCPTAHGAAGIRLLDKARVDSGEVRLGEIAKVFADSGDMEKRLVSIVVAKSPLPGRTRALSARTVGLRLRQNGVDTEKVSFSGPGSVVVERSCTRVKKKRILNAVVDHLLEKMPWNPMDVAMDVFVPEDVILPAGELSIHVETMGHPDYLGKMLLPVFLSIDNRMERRVMVTVDIHVTKDVVVTTRPLRRFEPIRESDLKVERRDLSHLSPEAIFDPARVRGARTRKALDVNTVLTRYLVEMPPVVKRGDVVQMVLETGSLTVSARGVVKSREGRPGASVLVTNAGSKKTVTARVVDSRTVRVEF